MPARISWRSVQSRRGERGFCTLTEAVKLWSSLPPVRPLHGLKSQSDKGREEKSINQWLRYQNTTGTTSGSISLNDNFSEAEREHFGELWISSVLSLYFSLDICHKLPVQKPPFKNCVYEDKNCLDQSVLRTRHSCYRKGAYERQRGLLL